MKYNAHTIQSFYNDVRQYLDWAFYTNLVLDSASFLTKLRLAVFSKDKDLRRLVGNSIKDDLESWHPLRGPLYAWKVLSPRFPDEELDPGSACDVIDYAPKWLLKKHFEEVYEAAPDIHRIWLMNRLGYDIEPKEGLPAVRKRIRYTARTRNCGNDLSISEYDDGYYYPSCNDFPGIGNQLAAIVGNGGLDELKAYIQFNEKIISKYVDHEDFQESGNECSSAVKMFWSTLDEEIHRNTELFLESELAELMAKPLPKEIKLFCSRPAQRWENGFLNLLYGEEKLPDTPDEDMIEGWKDRAAAEEALAMNQLGIMQILFPEIDTGYYPSEWFEQAIELNYAPAMLNYAAYLSAEENYDWRGVCDMLIESFKKGVYPAMYKLCYLSLTKVSPGSPLEKQLIDMLDKLAPAEAMSSYFLAEAYYQGIIVPKDDEKAFKYANIIAHDTGDVYAYQYRLGYMYQKGIGTVQDTEKAMVWYRKALENPLCTEEFRRKAEQGIEEINGKY